MAKLKREDRNLKFETLQLHVGQEQADPVTDARAVPIYQTSSYVFHNSDHAEARFGLSDAGNIYGRLTNPTADIFEQRIAALEGGVAALAVASGAAAISYTLKTLAQNGDHIVSASNIYGGTYNYLEHTLPQDGVQTTFVDIANFDEVEAAIQDNTKAVFIETLGNPNSDVVDIEGIAKIAHAHKIPLVIDNTFGTPYLIRPIEYGADIVVHSATKFIGGHGTTIGGVIVDSGKFDWEASGKFASLTEPNPSYHGISFTKAVGPAAFVTKIRAILLRLFPLLSMYKAEDFDDAVDKADELVQGGGIGHTAGIYIDVVNNQEKLNEFERRMKACRILVNTPSAQGGIGDIYNFKLSPSLTLG